MSQVIGENNQTFALARISKMLVGFWTSSCLNFCGSYFGNLMASDFYIFLFE
jgi:hypothetical protein